MVLAQSGFGTPVGPNVGQNGESLAQPEVVPPVFIGVKLCSEELCDAVRGFDNSSLVNIPADCQLLHNFGNAVGGLVASILSSLQIPGDGLSSQVARMAKRLVKTARTLVISLLTVSKMGKKHNTLRSRRGLGGAGDTRSTGRGLGCRGTLALEETTGILVG